MAKDGMRKGRFDWSWTSLNQVETRVADLKETLEEYEAQAQWLLRELKEMGVDIQGSEVTEEIIFDTVIEARSIHDRRSVVFLRDLEKLVQQELLETHKAYRQLEERLRQVARQMQELEDELADLLSFQDLYKVEGTLTNESWQAVQHVATRLEQHKPFAEELPAIRRDHAGRLAQRSQQDRVRTVVELLKLFAHAAQLAEKDREAILNLMREQRHQLDDLISLLPPDLRHRLAA